MNTPLIITISLTILMSTMGILGQISPASGPSYNKTNQGPIDPATGQSEWTKIQEGRSRGTLQISTVEAPSSSAYYRVVAVKEAKKRAKVDKRILEENKDFLAGPNTGVFKLLPTIGCAGVKENKREKCLIDAMVMYFAGNAYSFIRRSYTLSSYADLALIANNLDARSSTFQVIMANLGNISFNEVTLATNGLKPMNEFWPFSSVPANEAVLKDPFSEVKIDGFTYSRSISVTLNDIVALRSIGYPAEGNGLLRKVDLTVIVKVVEKDEDGSLTVLWKQLAGSGMEIRGK